MFRSVRELIKKLKCEELEFENKKVRDRGDRKDDKRIERRLEECGVLIKSNFEKEKCLDCNIPIKYCPLKKEFVMEIERKKWQ